VQTLSPLNPLQRAVFELLADDAALTIGLGAQVWDEVPEGTRPERYVVIGEQLSLPSNTQTSRGREVTLTLHVWTRAAGNATGQAIAARVIELLDHQVGALDVDGHDVLSIRHEFDHALRDSAPGVRHIVLRFRVITSQH
jgi:hypothetical protein